MSKFKDAGVATLRFHGMRLNSRGMELHPSEALRLKI